MPSAASPLCLPLYDPEATLRTVGGKGASLARMAAAGLPVPAGFHITTAAYRKFVEANGFQKVIMEALAGASDEAPALPDRASLIQELFSRGVMPDEISASIRSAYLGLGEEQPAVAVRSSATAEDLPNLSFAGQHESFLNVHGQASVLDAVLRCWASLWSARAIGYRDRARIGHHTVAMGVVVQLMVPAEISGVLFTADPATGDLDKMVVNAGFGLGEAIVSGRVTPDTYVVGRSNPSAAAVTIGSKEVMVVPSAGEGTITRAVSERQRSERALSESLLAEIASLGLRAEELFEGVPQDVEWAVAKGRCLLLQSRPITNLPPPPLRDVRWDPPIPGSAWVRRQVVEHMPEPLSPLFEELYLWEGLQRSLRSLMELMGMPRLVDRLISPPYFTTVNGYAYLRGDVNFRWWVVFPLIPIMIAAVRKMFRIGVPYWEKKGLPDYLAVIDRWKRIDPVAGSDKRLLAGVRELAGADAIYWFPSALAIGAAKVTDAALNWFLSRFAKDRGMTSGMFLRGFSSKTLQAQLDLEDIAERIRADGELLSLVEGGPAERLMERISGHPEARRVMEKIRGYFDRYGHLIYNLDFAAPTQADDPRPFLLSIKALALQPGRDTRRRQSAPTPGHEKWIARSLGPIRGMLFLWLLAKARRFAPYREAALFYMGAAWPTLRRLALELGRRLVTAGTLGEADDVFFLESGEVAAACAARAEGKPRPDLGRLARERRALREARKRLHPPSTVPPSFRFKFGPIDLSSREAQRRNTAEDRILRGFAVFPGKITAPASVILSPSDFDRMVPNTILVCPTITPAWTPLLAQARGLVTDIGGILAHGSIVAREYGIPAVMGTGIGTTRILSGQMVTVNGDAGTVVPEEGHPSITPHRALSIWI